MTFMLREFRLEDAQETYQLFFDTVHHVNIKDYNKEQCDIWAPADKNIEEWGDSLAKNYSYVAVDEHSLAIIGFSDIEASGYLNRGYVHKGYQGQGIGRALLNIREDKARELGLKRVFSNVSETAKSFYLRLGYKIVKEQTRELNGMPFTQYRMEKEL